MAGSNDHIHPALGTMFEIPTIGGETPVELIRDPLTGERSG